MIKYIMMLSVFATLTMNAQKSNFDNMLKLFSESNQIIPEDIAFQYFDFKPSERADKLLAGKIIIKTESYTIISTILECNIAKSCEQSFLTSFNHAGERIGTLVYERTIKDCSFDDTRESVFVYNDMLVFREVRKKIDCLGNGKQKGIEQWIEFQPIVEDGTFSKPYTDPNAMERENYIFSHKAFVSEELDYKTEGELSIIKNEIYASHGYIFTTEKWKNYFESKSWYKPSERDVENKLSEIEKKNVELIVTLIK